MSEILAEEANKLETSEERKAVVINNMFVYLWNTDSREFLQEYVEVGGEEGLGKHLVDKFFRECHRDIHSFWSQLDAENMVLIVKMVENRYGVIDALPF